MGGELTGLAHHIRRGALLAAACLFLGGIPASAQDAPSAKHKEALDKLRAGGLIVYIRHTQTDSKTEDKDLSNMSNCATQRLLSDVGRENAVKLGEAFKALAIPVGDVITS